MVERMLRNNLGELSSSFLSYNAMMVQGLGAEDLVLYFIFPVVAGFAVHLFRRVTDKIWFNKDQEREDNEKNEKKNG